MSTTIRRKRTAKARLDEVIQIALCGAGRHLRTRRVFERLLHLVRRQTGLLRPTGAGGRDEERGRTQIVVGLLALASHHGDWLRPADDWVPSGCGPLPQFAALAEHLLARYPMPPFMASAWFGGREPGAARRQGWYKHMGIGRNIRTADVPLLLTKRMAHEFTLAPDHYSVDKALRWGQVRGLGGSRELARAVVATRLGRSFEHEDFWRTAVHFLVNHPELGMEHVGPIVDYLHSQRFAAREVFVEEGDFSLDPPQPRLSMKGRTPRSLLGQVGEWHAWLRRTKRVREHRWRRSGIGEFRLGIEPEVPNPRCWTIRELLTSGELYREGAAMRHCVASYTGACARRETSIWSMRFESAGRHHRVLTIEVDLATRTICQARRRANARPNAKLRSVIEEWARREGLKIEY
jgi:PcfJ-like protein